MRYKTLACILLLAPACGTVDAPHCDGGCYIAGDHSQEELTALVDVLRAFQAVDAPEPSAAVRFVHSPDMPFRGTTWADWRTNAEPRNQAEGYRGLWDPEFCCAYVRRFGEAEPYLHSLLVHELAHAIGYQHGEKMREFEAMVRANIK